jgi:alpha-L-rhamnosidase
MLLALGGRTVVAGNSVSVKDLRCEHRVNPLGIDVVRPRFNRILQSGERGQKQTVFRVNMEIVTCRSNILNS